MSFNYLDILKQIRDLLMSIDKTLKDVDNLLWEIKKNTDNLKYDE